MPFIEKPLNIKPVGNDFAPLGQFVMPNDKDNREHLLLGGSPCCFYLTLLGCDENRMIGRICYNADGQIVAAFHLSLPDGKLNIKRAPDLTSTDHLRQIIEESERILMEQSDVGLLEISSWIKLQDFSSFLKKNGFSDASEEEIIFEFDFGGELDPPRNLDGVSIRELNEDDELEVESRAKVQGSAFSGKDLDSVGAWGIRNIQRMVDFRRCTGGSDLVVLNQSGTVVSFAAFDLYKKILIGEFDPIGTLPGYQRKGLAKAVILDGLRRMKKSGMKKAMVRTHVDVIPAIKTYESIGFKKVDRAISYGKRLGK